MALSSSWNSLVAVRAADAVDGRQENALACTCHRNVVHGIDSFMLLLRTSSDWNPVGAWFGQRYFSQGLGAFMLQRGNI